MDGKCGEKMLESNLDATVHAYDFQMILDEVLSYIEQRELSERFGACDNDMRSYAPIANGITYMRRTVNDRKYTVLANISTVAEYLQPMLDRGYLWICCQIRRCVI